MCGSGGSGSTTTWSSFAGRCRPNTVLAAAYDLKVFFTVVDKPPADVVAADVLGFINALRTGGVRGERLQRVSSSTEPAGVVARRLSIVSGFFAYCKPVATSPRTRCPVGCLRGASAPVRARGCR